jgi:hypothetical protein
MVKLMGDEHYNCVIVSCPPRAGCFMSIVNASSFVQLILDGETTSFPARLVVSYVQFINAIASKRAGFEFRYYLLDRSKSMVYHSICHQFKSQAEAAPYITAICWLWRRERHCSSARTGCGNQIRTANETNHKIAEDMVGAIQRCSWHVLPGP